MNRLVLFGALAALLFGHASRAAAQSSTSGPGPIVSTEWLQQHLSDPLVRVIFTGPPNQYDLAHIPGARLFDLGTAFGPNRMLDGEPLAAVLAKAGAADGVRVILYDGGNGWATGVLFVAFASLGHADDVSVLDGSIEVWQKEGRPVSTAAPAMADGQLSVRPTPGVIVDAEWVRSRLKSPDLRVLDVRSPGEWSAGHLPGATLVLWEDLFADQRMLKLKSLDEMRTVFARAGVKPGQEVVTYCAVGLRASLMYWAAVAVGLPARVYAGSYQDWQRNPDNPIIGW